MTETIFFRLLADEDKGAALSSAIGALQDSQDVSAAHVANPASFARIPGSPFAYWVSESFRGKFVELPKLENAERTARFGLSTKNDFRFLRVWWECHCANVGSRWVNLVKGGEYAPFYSDVHLVLEWEGDGRRLKAFATQRTAEIFGSGSWSRWINSTDFYFRPGLTWPRRTNGLSFRALPAGCIFADKGPAVFVKGDNADTLLCLAAIANSRAFFAFVQLMLARVSLAQSFEVGLIQSVPVPTTSLADSSALSDLACLSLDHKRDLGRVNETNHAFVFPAMFRAEGANLEEWIVGWKQKVADINAMLLRNQEDMDEIVFRLYGVSESDRRAIDDASLSTESSLLAEERNNAEDGVDEVVSLDHKRLVEDLVSYLLGCAFGRWDVRIALNPSLAPVLQGPFEPLPICSPGMLVGPDGLPATSGRIVSEKWLRARPNAITLPPEGSIAGPVIADDEYPVAIDWDGILVDDPDHADDFVRRVRDVLHVLWGKRADALEREACQILGGQELRKYLRDSRRFFEFHLKRYSKSRRKAPIYWPLSTTSGSYTLWLYYPRLTSDTLYTAVNRYVEPKLQQVARSLRDVETRMAGATGRQATKPILDRERLGAFHVELEALRAELLRVAALPYRPNLDDGVIINAAPLHTLFRHRGWASATRDCWQKLQRGDYDWAHLAHEIWPERVREKCCSDRSLAIAHDLEDLYVAPPTASKKEGKRGRPQATLLAEDEA